MTLLITRLRDAMDKTVKVWFDAEAAFLEVVFQDAPAIMVETDDEAVMKRVDAKIGLDPSISLSYTHRS